MKQMLKRIYQDLYEGRLSKAEALESIRALKAATAGQDGAGTSGASGISGASGALIAVPAWEESAATPGSNADYSRQHVLLCGFDHLDLPSLESLVPRSHCRPLPGMPGLSDMPTDDLAKAYGDAALACFERVQEVLRGKPQGKVLIQAVIPDEPQGLLLAGLSALLRTAAAESRHLVGQVLLVDPRISAEALAAHLREDASAPQDALIRRREGVRLVSAWKEMPAPGEAGDVAFKEGGAYLITGGLGGLGRLLTREILRRTGKARIILTGRAESDAGKLTALEAMGAPAGTLDYRQLDLGRLDQVEDLCAEINASGPGLRGILHCAGFHHDNFITGKSREEFLRVLAPKVTGARNLDLASRDLDLDFMIFFSSLAAPFGNLGQADYASANAFMDRYAEYRNRLAAEGRRKGKTLSINWPLWREGGMRVDHAGLEMFERTTGLLPLETADGMRALHRGLGLPASQVLVLSGDPGRLRRMLTPSGPAGAEASPSSRPAQAAPAVAAVLDTGSLLEKTQDYLCAQFSNLLKLPAQAIDPRSPLGRYGMDSILAMSLTNQLEKTFGTLSKTLFFEYQTVRDIAGYFLHSHSAALAKLFSPGEASPQAGAAAAAPAAMQPVTLPVRTRRPSPRPLRRAGAPAAGSGTGAVAIIGLSGRYPGAADVQEFWRNLRDGKDCITEVPEDRWDWRRYYSEERDRDGSHHSKWGGFIGGVDEFDPRFFSISPREAATIDPQERLFLQHAWSAVEDAGYSRAGLQIPHAQDLPGQVGVYAGVMYGEYNLSGTLASIANRVSYVLNLHGPSMTVDSMCSSSLTAIHLACQDLKLGRIDLAIAGGVNVTIHPGKYQMLSKGRFLSGDGHCQSFGEGGDGYIPGEGVGAVVLKRLADAERDGDHIYGVILGSALNHGGRTNGFSVPNPNAQAAAIGRALSEAGVDPRLVGYIEAHGTGTKLGDPIEVAALSSAFTARGNGTCLIGSAKSNIGHCESAAGIAGLTKVLLQMKHGKIVPSLHSSRLNPHIDFGKTPFVVNQTLRDWEAPVADGRPLPRIAGISSFGAGGSNAHLIVREYSPAMPPGAAPGAEHLIPLSARTEEQLRQKARDLLDFVKDAQAVGASGPGGRLDLEAMAYTLQVGREEMEERLAILAKTPGQLAERLETFLAGQAGEDCYRGQAKRERDALSLLGADADMQETIAKWIARGKLAKLAELWVRGLELEWTRLYGEHKPPRISLPSYPFARERHWQTPAAIAAAPSVMVAAPAAIVAASADIVAAPAVATPAVIHPLLHVNTSDLQQTGYSSTFTGEEPFLAHSPAGLEDHPDGKELPAAACLEMARAAVEKALGGMATGGLELRQVVWGQPLIVRGGRQVDIALFARSGEQVDFEIYSRDPHEDLIHCQGHAFTGRPPARGRIDLGSLMGQLRGGRWEAAQVYALLSEAGQAYGPAYQVILGLERGEQQALAHLRLSSPVESELEPELERFVLHPTLVDGALQACIGVLEHPARLPLRPSFPAAIESLRIHSPCAREMFAWVRPAAGGSVGGSRAGAAAAFDVDLCDRDGNVCVQMLGVSHAAPQKNSRAAVELEIALPAAEATHVPPAPQRKQATSGKPLISLSSVA